MRYPAFMVMLGPAVVVMMAVSVAPTPARRLESGSLATVTVNARIVSASARIGAGFAAPMSRMVARRITVSAADGRPVEALVYDFE